MTEISFRKAGGWVDKLVNTGVEPNTPAIITKYCPYHKLRVETEDGEIIGDGQDTETVTISVISGLDFVSNDRETVISYSGEVTGTVDGTERTAQITDGTVSFDVTTDKPAGETVEIEAMTLGDVPADPDEAEIEVVE